MDCEELHLSPLSTVQVNNFILRAVIYDASMSVDLVPAFAFAREYVSVALVIVPQPLSLIVFEETPNALASPKPCEYPISRRCELKRPTIIHVSFGNQR